MESSSPVITKGLDERRFERGHTSGDQPASRKEPANRNQPVPEFRPAPSKRTAERQSAPDRPPANCVRLTAEVRPTAEPRSVPRAPEKEHEHEQYSPSSNVTISWRDSNAQRDEYTRSSPIRFRAAPHRNIQRRIESITVPSTPNDDSDIEDGDVSCPPKPRTPLQKPSMHGRSLEASVNRPIER